MMTSKVKASLTTKEVKEKFLENNPKFHEVKDSNSSIGEFYSINEDDEVWIMQCPKGIDISVLKDHKIKLPGRSNQDELETVAVEHPQPILHSFGYKNRKGHNNIKIIAIQGSIILRSRLKSMALPDEAELDVRSTRVPMPVGIKERHPLHGIDYKSKLQINPEIAQRLKLADKISVRQPPKKKSKSKSKRKEPSTIALDSDSDVELVTQKKAKKKKRKNPSEGDVLENNTLEKKKKMSLSNDVAEDLQWIQKL